MSTQHTELVTAGLKAGHSKMQILTELVRVDAELDLTAAGAVYKEVASEGGYLLTNDEKAELVIEVAVQHVDENAVMDREASIKDLMEKAHISETAATGRLKDYCTKNKIEFPNKQRGRDMEAVNTAYKTWWGDDVEEEQIKAGLVQHFKYTEKNVDAAYTRIGKALGLISGGRSNVAAIVAWFKVPGNVEGTKKEIVARMVTDGITESTAQYRYKLYEFGVQFAKTVDPVDSEAMEEAA